MTEQFAEAQCCRGEDARLTGTQAGEPPLDARPGPIPVKTEPERG